MSDRAFGRAVAVLAAFRVAPTFVVLAANGHSLPLFPGDAYGPPGGDTYGYYAAAREFISVWIHLARGLRALVVLVLVGGVAIFVAAWRRGRRAEAVAAGSIALGVLVSIGVHKMPPTGTGAVGWPIIWSIPLFPLRATGHLSYHAAYYLGIVVLALCNVVTLVATALLGRRVVGPRLALLAPALLAVWPFAMRALEGTGNGVYGAWLNDVGVLLYSEPVSTALATVALALVVLRPFDDVAAALAGALCGAAVTVRLSDAAIAVVLFATLLLTRRLGPPAFFAICGAGTLLVALMFWSRGYASFATTESGPRDPHGLFSWHYMIRVWRNSVVFDWNMLAILLPLPVLGIVALRKRPIELLPLAGVVASTAVFYSLYYITELHPRFLFVALPPFFVLAAAGVGLLARAVAYLRGAEATPVREGA